MPKPLGNPVAEAPSTWEPLCGVLKDFGLWLRGAETTWEPGYRNVGTALRDTEATRTLLQTPHGRNHVARWGSNSRCGYDARTRKRLGLGVNENRVQEYQDMYMPSNEQPSTSKPPNNAYQSPARSPISPGLAAPGNRSLVGQARILHSGGSRHPLDDARPCLDHGQLVKVPFLSLLGPANGCP